MKLNFTYLGTSPSWSLGSSGDLSPYLPPADAMATRVAKTQNTTFIFL